MLSCSWMMIDYSARHVTSLCVSFNKPFDEHEQQRVPGYCALPGCSENTEQAELAIPAETAKYNPDDFRRLLSQKLRDRHLLSLHTGVWFWLNIRHIFLLVKRAAPAPSIRDSNTFLFLPEY